MHRNQKTWQESNELDKFEVFKLSSGIKELSFYFFDVCSAMLIKTKLEFFET